MLLKILPNTVKKNKQQHSDLISNEKLTYFYYYSKDKVEEKNVVAILFFLTD